MEKPLRSERPAVSWQRGGVLRLGGSAVVEIDDEWQASEWRYPSEASMAKLAPTDDHGPEDKDVGTKGTELLVS